MPNLYDALTQALREHWTAHANAYPQAFELTAQDLQALLQARKLVNASMNFQLTPGWEREFLGVPLQTGAVNCLVTVDGQRQPLTLVVAEPSQPS